MKKLSNEMAVAKFKEIAKRLSDIRIKKDCDLTISIYDAGNPEEDTCTHTLKSSSDHSLIKLLSIVGIVSVMLSAICCVCSLFKD
ncbi:MAG: hypothetical protein IJV72_03925 [Clostridia bacterium]|nr:hypothetical protein [Clostridia bacterium]